MSAMKSQQYELPPPRRSGKIAWLALLFSFLALLMSSASLLLHFENTPLFRKAQLKMQEFQKSLPAKQKSPAAGLPASQSAPAETGAVADSRSAAPSDALDRVREKLYRAETMIRNQDGRAGDYLSGLKADLERLGAQTSEQGGRWIAEAAEKIRSIREQVARDGPQAAQRLHDLAADIRQKAQTMQRVGAALSAFAPARSSATPATAADDAAPSVPAVPRVPEVDAQ